MHRLTWELVKHGPYENRWARVRSAQLRADRQREVVVGGSVTHHRQHCLCWTDWRGERRPTAGSPPPARPAADTCPARPITGQRRRGRHQRRPPVTSHCTLLRDIGYCPCPVCPDNPRFALSKVHPSAYCVVGWTTVSASRPGPLGRRWQRGLWPLLACREWPGSDHTVCRRVYYPRPAQLWSVLPIIIVSVLIPFILPYSELTPCLALRNGPLHLPFPSDGPSHSTLFWPDIPTSSTHRIFKFSRHISGGLPGPVHPFCPTSHVCPVCLICPVCFHCLRLFRFYCLSRLSHLCQYLSRRYPLTRLYPGLGHNVMQRHAGGIQYHSVCVHVQAARAASVPGNKSCHQPSDPRHTDHVHTTVTVRDGSNHQV